jgi:hypothetical protein
MIRNLLIHVLLLMCLTLVASVDAAEKIDVFIRVDDLFSKNSPVRPMEMDEFLKIAEKHGAHVTIAAIPNRLLQPVNENGHMTQALLDYASRGHQIIQHGFDHQCAFSGDTGREFSTPEAMANLTQEQRVEKILEGRQLLEAVLGRPMTAYCGPGADDTDLLAMDAPLLREKGYTWLKDAPEEALVMLPEGGGSYPIGQDFAWGLTEENYQERLEGVQEYCRRTAAAGGTCCVKFHDPFTRAGYENGIVLRWTEEVLTWLESQSEWEIQYVTLDEYYARETAEAP